MPLTSSVVTKGIKFQVVLLLAENSDAEENVRVSFGTSSILHFYGNSVRG